MLGTVVLVAVAFNQRFRGWRGPERLAGTCARRDLRCQMTLMNGSQIS